MADTTYSSFVEEYDIIHADVENHHISKPVTFSRQRYSWIQASDFSRQVFKSMISNLNQQSSLNVYFYITTETVLKLLLYLEQRLMFPNHDSLYKGRGTIREHQQFTKWDSYAMQTSQPLQKLKIMEMQVGRTVCNTHTDKKTQGIKNSTKTKHGQLKKKICSEKTQHNKPQPPTPKKDST